MRLPVKVVPGASRDSIEWLDAGHSILKVRVTAAPEKGRANKAVVRLLAQQLALPASAIAIVSGSTSQHKQVTIDGISEADFREKLP